MCENDTPKSHYNKYKFYLKILYKDQSWLVIANLKLFLIKNLTLLES